MNIEWHRPKNSIIEILNRNRKFIDSEIQSQCKYNYKILSINTAVDKLISSFSKFSIHQVQNSSRAGADWPYNEVKIYPQGLLYLSAFWGRLNLQKTYSFTEPIKKKSH
jgi:hypothetical protein